MRLIHQRTPGVPVTSLSLLLPGTGACRDPEPRQGLTRLLLRLLFTGAGGLSNTELNGRLERLGATMGHGLGSDHVALRLTTLSDNLDAALELFLLTLHEPAFAEEEYHRLQAELVSGWRTEREESKQLRAYEVYARTLYRGAPTGYQADGLEAGLRATTVAEARAHYPRLFGQGEPILAVLSDLSREEVARRVGERLKLPPGEPLPPSPWEGFAPEEPPQRRVVIVPEAGTNTDEIFCGAFSAGETDPDWHIHRLIALIFGGDMNSRLFRIIRGENGFSYGASCWYEAGQGRRPRNRVGPFSLYTFPSAEHTARALPLLVSLYEELVAGGVTPEELEQARSALANSHPFLRDTPQKLLGLEIEEALYGVVTDDEATFRAKLEAVTPADVARVLRATHHPERATLVLLGDPARLEPLAAALPGVGQVERVVYP